MCLKAVRHSFWHGTLPCQTFLKLPSSPFPCRYADKQNMEVGLLFTCRLGNVDLERPVGEHSCLLSCPFLPFLFLPSFLSFLFNSLFCCAATRHTAPQASQDEFKRNFSPLLHLSSFDTVVSAPEGLWHVCFVGVGLPIFCLPTCLPACVPQPLRRHGLAARPVQGRACGNLKG